MNKNILLIDKYISEKVTQLRIDKNIPVKEFAELLNVEDSFIRKVETFKNKYNIYHLFLISNYLKVNIQNFFPPTNNNDTNNDFKDLYSFKKYSSKEELIKDLENEISNRKN